MTDALKMAREALAAMLLRDERNTCPHDETHRGGAIWTICDECGMKWADDEGGKPEWQDPQEWEKARAAIAAIDAHIRAEQIGHIYDGDCPDDTQPDSRDPECPACVALGQAGAAIDAQQAATVGAPLDSPEVTALWQQFCRTAAYRHALQWVKDDEVPGALFTAFRAGLNATPPAVQAPLTDKQAAELLGFKRGIHFDAPGLLLSEFSEYNKQRIRLVQLGWNAAHGIGAAAQGGEQ